jgi:hypothetical protein
MSNMGYCRFRNTLEDLMDCEERLFDDLSEDEAKARKRLVKLCQTIAEDAEEIMALDDEEDGGR